MKKFSSELGYNFNTYTFGYTNYCSREPNDKLADIYAQGYLPYSGSLNVKNTFYMARSARIPLGTFVLSSENRRIAKKFDNHFEIDIVPIEKFAINNPGFINFCTEYFAQRHGSNIMPELRLKTILSSGIITDIVSFRNEINPTAFVFEVSDKEIAHFWFSFYDLSLVHKSLGLWLMINNICRAKEQGKKYFYLGTVYGQKALYKTAFKNIEYWDGHEWISNLKKIKSLGRNDVNRVTGLTDLWKKDKILF